MTNEIKLICPLSEIKEVCCNYWFTKGFCNVMDFPQCSDCPLTKEEYKNKI